MENENKKTLHITITDKASGEICADTDTQAVIAVFDEADGVRGVFFTECTAWAYAHVVAKNLKTLEYIKQQNPEVYKQGKKLAKRMKPITE